MTWVTPAETVPGQHVEFLSMAAISVSYSLPSSRGIYSFSLFSLFLLFLLFFIPTPQWARFTVG